MRSQAFVHANLTPALLTFTKIVRAPKALLLTATKLSKAAFVRERRSSRALGSPISWSTSHLFLLASTHSSVPLVGGCGASGSLHLPYKHDDVVGQRLCIFKRNPERANDLFEGELQQKSLHLAVGVFARPKWQECRAWRTGLSTGPRGVVTVMELLWLRLWTGP